MIALDYDRLEDFLKEYDFKSVSDMIGYIQYLEDVKKDYYTLKKEVTRLHNIMDRLF